jgi:hypothetical protein
MSCKIGVESLLPNEHSNGWVPWAESQDSLDPEALKYVRTSLAVSENFHIRSCSYLNSERNPIILPRTGILQGTTRTRRVVQSQTQSLAVPSVPAVHRLAHTGVVAVLALLALGAAPPGSA